MDTVSSLARNVILVSILYQINPAFALDWKSIPTLTVQETYSDNINLGTKGNEKGAFVTEVIPALNVYGISSRWNINLNYRMQNVYNAGGDGNYDINNQLLFNTTYSPIRNSLFLNAHSSITQQNNNNARIVTDNLSGSNFRSNVITYGISPYWTPHLGGYANGLVRFNFDALDVNDNSQFSTISNTKTTEELINLRSGNKFKHITWFINYTNRDEKRDIGNNVTFQNSSAEIRWRYSRKYNVFVQVGQSNNDFATTTDSNNNGFFYTFGAAWRPSLFSSIEAGIGNNSFVTVDLYPTRLMHWRTNYRNKDVGLNTGNTWQTAFNYRTRRTTWRATYNVDTTTVQNVLLQQNVLGALPSDQPFQSVIGLPTFSNEVIVRNRAEFGFSYSTGKTIFNASIFNEKRDFQASQNKENVIGARGSVNIRFWRRNNAFLSADYQHSKGDTVVTANNAGIGFNNNLYNVRLGLTRSISRRISGNLEYRYINQSSDIDLNNYQENRITAGLSMRWW